MPVRTNLIAEVRKNIKIPLIVGGGIRTQKQAKDIFDAGADIIVIGTVAEENPEALREIVSAKKWSARVSATGCSTTLGRPCVRTPGRNGHPVSLASVV